MLSIPGYEITEQLHQSDSGRPCTAGAAPATAARW